MNKVTFFTKACCPLCDSAWFVIKKLRQRIEFDLERIDITDPKHTKWFGLYCNDIPVVHINGTEVCRHRVSERALRRRLQPPSPD